MLIRTQNKSALLLLENISFLAYQKVPDSNKYRIVTYIKEGTLGIGTYDSEEACKEVLENIYYCYGNKCICYQMPEVLEE